MMTQEEKQQLNTVLNNSERIHKDISDIKSALLGNPLAGDDGITGRLHIIELRQDKQDAKIEILIKEKVKNDVYIKIINFLLVTISTSVIGATIALIYNHSNN